jgi:hypothetical protein
MLGLAGTVALCWLYYSFNPQHCSFFPECPFYKLTGFDCPGCGSQRAIYSLLHGELLRAIYLNLLLIISLPFLAIHFAYKLASIIKRKEIRWPVIYHPLTPKIVFVVVISFWILRNIPAYPFSLFRA